VLSSVLSTKSYYLLSLYIYISFVLSILASLLLLVCFFLFRYFSMPTEGIKHSELSESISNSLFIKIS
jgi:hypothetical protein